MGLSSARCSQHILPLVPQQAKAAVARSHSTDSEDNYVPMNPGSSPLIHTEKANDNAQNLYIPMSPGPHHFDLVGLSSATLPVHKGGAVAQCHRRLSEIQPPPVNRNLKPDRKGKIGWLGTNLPGNPSVLLIIQTASVKLCPVLGGVRFAAANTVRPSDVPHALPLSGAL